jgi:hypothetical protein
MCLDVIWWLIPGNRPAVLPIPGRVDVPSLKPQLECFGYNHRTRAVRRRRNVDEGDKFGGK